MGFCPVMDLLELQAVPRDMLASGSEGYGSNLEFSFLAIFLILSEMLRGVCCLCEVYAKRNIK